MRTYDDGGASQIKEEGKGRVRSQGRVGGGEDSLEFFVGEFVSMNRGN